MLILDTHTHVYSTDEVNYPPIAKPLRPPVDSGSLKSLERVTRENGVIGVCIVQVSSFYGWDNRFVCDTAAKNQRWTSGICTLDPDDPHSPGLIQHYAKKYGVRGLRSVPAQDGKMDGPGVTALWKACEGSGIVVNALCYRDNADTLARMVEKFRHLNVVLDHCLNLKAGPEQNATLADVVRLAKYENTHAKLSFLGMGSAEDYPFRDLHEPCRRIIAAYTPDRCVWGSDFPCELWTPKATYRQNLRLFTEVLSLGTAAREAILGKVALRLYFRGKLASR